MLKRFLQSKLLRGLLMAAVVVAIFTAALGGLSNRVNTNQAAFVEASVRRSAVQCYALEGRYPPSLGGVQYLEENYGLTVDYSRYAVYYENMGSNLLPQIRVIEIVG
ncbi:MAG: hypothetical protein LBR39_05835 [Coriobacteriales bacterium]|jgi:hypothetical protein|nr:hypothetical protein [Coriobacteriales bacterium]